MKVNLKKVLKFAAVAGVCLLAIEPAFATGTYGTAAGSGAGLGNLTENLRSSATSITDILSLVSYVVGVGFGIKAALKFKESNENKGQTPISQPITLMVVSALLLSLPTLLIMGKDAVLGTGASSTGIDEGNLRSLN